MGCTPAKCGRPGCAYTGAACTLSYSDYWKAKVCASCKELGEQKQKQKQKNNANPK
jgi:hypothetical protein